MGRRAVVLVIALVLAAAAAFAIFQYLAAVRDDVLEEREQVDVFRAVQPITEGTEGDLILQGSVLLYEASKEQRGDLPNDAITTQADLEAVLRGKVAVGPISGNAILALSQWGTITLELKPLKESIDAGKQAITISPGDVQGVNGLVQPGDLINVILTIDLELGLTEGAQLPDFGIPTTETAADGTIDPLSVIVPYTRTMLQNIEVLAVGRDVAVSDTDAPQITATPEGEVAPDAGGQVQGTDATAPAVSTIYTLQVDPSQAERLVYATEQGSIYLALVPDDNQLIVTTGVTINSLFEGNLLNDIFNN